MRPISAERGLLIEDESTREDGGARSIGTSGITLAIGKELVWVVVGAATTVPYIGDPSLPSGLCMIRVPGRGLVSNGTNKVGGWDDDWGIFSSSSLSLALASTESALVVFRGGWRATATLGSREVPTLADVEI